MEIVLSGIRPTGQLHLGNYFGALKNFTKMQHDAECYFFIADYHALTTHPDPSSLHTNIRGVLAQYLAAGLDPEVATIYVQSDVPEVTELSTLLSMHAYLGELERTVSFKDKARKQPNNVNAGLLCYPVLMAADILLHRAAKVPVGKDQEQHLELTRLFARRFNSLYKTDLFPEPQAYNFGAETVKIPGLDGSGKMGKSEGNCIYLSDSDEVIRKKVMKATTDSGPTEPNSPISEPVQNIFTIMESVSEASTIEYFKDKYASCEIRYGDLKKQLAADIIETVTPIREKIADIYNNDKYLHEVTAAGAERARKSASETVRLVRETMGIYHF
ncbi:MAG: tryptophan--tRNA ligase [Rikenellaceae bacterium]